LASTNNDTLTSYLSLLMTSGLDQWSNPAIDKATAVSDFDFRDIRKAPVSVYLVVQPMMVKPLAALIRLFFSDLLSAMQDKEPGPDEPWPVMIMLDEFNRLGKMPIVVESIETLRSYKGHLAIVTQTIPALDEIYGENTRRALQGNAGIKVYLTPSDEKTVEELSKAVGKTTKRVVTRSRALNKNPFEGRSETSLLTEDEARRLPLDDIVLVIDAQMPIRAKRIKYFEDPFFKSIHDAQTGELPFPETTIESGNAATPAPEYEQEEPEGKPVATEPTPPTEPEVVSGSGSGEKAEDTTQSIAQGAAAPHQDRVVMSKRKRRASKAVENARRQDRQRELDLSVQQQLVLPDVVEATEANIQALQAADESLAELEATLAAQQGGVTNAA